jgi:hypothetical protein
MNTIYKTNALLSEMRELLEYYAIKYGMTNKDHDGIAYAIDTGVITNIGQLEYKLKEDKDGKVLHCKNR